MAFAEEKEYLGGRYVANLFLLVGRYDARSGSAEEPYEEVEERGTSTMSSPWKRCPEEISEGWKAKEER